MNSKERMLAAIEFRRPDKIPVFYHSSPAGLYVHGEKLRDLFAHLQADNLVDFPDTQPDPKYIDPTGQYHELSTDEWGVEWEFLIYGIQGHPHKHPFDNWQDARKYQFPAIKKNKKRSPERQEQYLLFGGTGSIFERPSALRPFDEVMVDFFTENPALLEFTDRLVKYYNAVNNQALQDGIDVFCFGDDFGTQINAIFPPDIFERVFASRYRKMFAPIQAANKKILFHSCGKIDSLLDQILDLNIDLIWPQLSLYGRDDAFLTRCADHQTALLLHPDRQYLIPRGQPTEIRAWVKDAADRYRNGGGIYYVEIENDAPWENVRTLIESILEYR